MITINIGRTFLKAYNEKYNQDLTAKDFFERVYFELFFNHPKYMQWVINSPFVQMKKGEKPHLLSTKERKGKLSNLKDKIARGEADASIAIGFPASESKEFATTSCLTSDIATSFTEDDMYCSWIGSGLGIGIAGGYTILFSDCTILLKLYEGWMVYRHYLNDKALSKLHGNQINTWNGQWLNYAFSKRFRSDYDFAELVNNGMFSIDETQIKVSTVAWSSLFFNLSNEFTDATITGYVYSFSKMNKTLGFFPFHFEKARTLRSYYTKLFGESAAIQQAADYEALFGRHIKRACELGSIGLQALEPKDLRKYYGDAKNIKLIKPLTKRKQNEPEEAFQERAQKNKQKDYENIIHYRTYKTWLLAMITKNKEESLDFSKHIASALHEYRDMSKKMARNHLIEKELLASKSKRQFLDALAEIIKEIDPSKLQEFKTLRDHIHMMNAEDFGYFVVLLKFDYAYVERERTSSSKGEE
ncbi:MAG: hypothetical protein PHP44_12605 [Kiritimatiellae bacterium]|nr:hypothetical protein [Kiritimatiellia bacterium]